MESTPLKFILLYILLPFIALLVGIVIYYLNKKMGLIKTKRIVITLIFSTVGLGLPGLFGLVDYAFMPYIYISLSILYFLLGAYMLTLINRFFGEIKAKGYAYEVIFILTQMFLGAGLFSLLFNLCNELQYGVWSCSCILPYLFVSLYRQTFRSYINIPLEIYTVWIYSPNKKVQSFNFNDCNEVMKIELHKHINDAVPNRITAKANDDMIFCEWFQFVLEYYNAQESVDKIECYDSDYPFGWVFYVKPSFFLPRRYIDPYLTIRENRLNRPYIIVARRAREQEQKFNKSIISKWNEN